jgi:hypothetical protein
LSHVACNTDGLIEQSNAVIEMMVVSIIQAISVQGDKSSTTGLLPVSEANSGLYTVSV